MGTSVLPYLYRFNGVVDTNKSVLDNMESLCSAAGTWLTYDIAQGKWAVIINKPTAPVITFDDSNILGGIQIGTTSLDQLYNAVKVSFPRADLNDQRDFVRAEIPAMDRNANEPDNDLNIDYDILNDPVQAEYLGLLELGQNRLDTTVTFATDYSNLGIRAGDVVAINSAQYGFSNYLVRVTSVTEVDTDGGAIQLQIIGVQYDEAIYEPDLNRYERSNQNGLVTLNAINQPGTPVVTKYEKDARPRIIATSTVPGTVPIEIMELWTATDNVNFDLVISLPPISGGTYTLGDTATFDFDQGATGNLYVKTRAVNSSSAGPFSAVTTVAYTPVQVTDAIGNNTSILNSSSVPISLLLAIPTLLSALDTKMNGNASELNGVPIVTRTSASISAASVLTQLNAMATGYTTNIGYDATYRDDPANWLSVGFSLPSNVKNFTMFISTPFIEADYETRDQTNTVVNLSAGVQPAMFLELRSGATLATSTVVKRTTIDWQANSNQISVANPTAGTYWFAGIIIPTYQLNLNWVRTGGSVQPNEVYFSNFANPSNSTLDLILDVTQ